MTVFEGLPAIWQIAHGRDYLMWCMRTRILDENENMVGNMVKTVKDMYLSQDQKEN